MEAGGGGTSTKSVIFLHPEFDARLIQINIEEGHGGTASKIQIFLLPCLFVPLRCSHCVPESISKKHDPRGLCHKTWRLLMRRQNFIVFTETCPWSLSRKVLTLALSRQFSTGAMFFSN